ncbi:MAG: EAL domain-containing protein [Pseudomonadota bacterium]
MKSTAALARTRTALAVSLVYIAAVALWIMLTDLRLPQDNTMLTLLQTMFATVSALLLYGYLHVRSELQRSREVEKKISRIASLYSALRATNRAIMRATNRTELFEEVCRIAVEYGQFKMAWIGEVELATRTIQVVAKAGDDAGYTRTLHISMDSDRAEGRGTSGTAVREGRHVVCNDLLADASMAPWHGAARKAGFAAVASFPLWQEGEVVGVMSLYPAQPDFFDQPLIDLLIEMARDISFALDNFKREDRRKRAEETLVARERQLEMLAHYDTLTGLPNRILLQDRVDQALTHASRHNKRVGLLYVDLDRFKNINDSLGHFIGDVLLQAMAQRFRTCIRDEDTISRLGGDEFIVVLPDTNIEGAAHVAQKILISAGERYEIEGHEMTVTPSIGISIYPEDGRNFDTLFKNADAAMHHAKSNGRNNYQFFTAQMNESALERLTLENGLRRALERGEFLLHYQPQIEIDSGRLLGMEALIRWQHPVLGLVPPGKFIPVAEESGLIVPIGEWVLSEACRQNRAWQEAGLPEFAVAVNLSALQFHQKNLPEKIILALEESGLDASYLELELTESLVMQHAEETITVMQHLKSMNLRLSIDDFGTGYSSLSYLKQLPIDRLKVDRSFVNDVASNPDDAAIVRAVISMAHNLRLRVIAEGVETEEQLAFLKSEGCDEMQGYYYSKPMPAADVAEFLADM